MLLQMSLKKGGADRDVHKALRCLLVPEEELQQVAQESQSFGEWLGDYIEYSIPPKCLNCYQWCCRFH